MYARDPPPRRPCSTAGREVVLHGAGYELVRRAIAPSSERSYLFFLGGWVKFRAGIVCRPLFVVESSSALGVVAELLEYVTYVYSVLGLQHTTIAGHLSAVKFFHRLAGAAELDTRHPLVREALRGIARGHAEEGTQQRLRRPLPLGVLKRGVDLVPQWGVGGRVLF